MPLEVQDIAKRESLSDACLPTASPRYWRYSHGTTWAELAEDLLVVDVPGDHFSLLRQEPADMEPLVRKHRVTM